MKLLVSTLAIGSAAAFTGQSPVRLVRSRAAPRSAGVSRAAVTAGVVTPEVWSKSPSVKVQGNTLKTWDLGDEGIERVQLSLKNGGRPIHTNVELWHTPSYVPTKFSIYTESGVARPVDVLIETPKHPKTVAVYNTGSLEFPFDATVAKSDLGTAYEALAGEESELVQGANTVRSVVGNLPYRFRARAAAFGPSPRHRRLRGTSQTHESRTPLTPGISPQPTSTRPKLTNMVNPVWCVFWRHISYQVLCVRRRGGQRAGAPQVGRAQHEGQDRADPGA